MSVNLDEVVQKVPAVNKSALELVDVRANGALNPHVDRARDRLDIRIL